MQPPPRYTYLLIKQRVIHQDWKYKGQSRTGKGTSKINEKAEFRDNASENGGEYNDSCPQYDIFSIWKLCQKAWTG